jgi:thiol:disulfide interchange protein DsbA
LTGQIPVRSGAASDYHAARAGTNRRGRDLDRNGNRECSMGRVRNLWLGVCALLAGSAAMAAPLQLVEGVHYKTLANPVTTDTGGKIEVLEAFSFGCIHCFNFEPALSAWKAKLPADVQVNYLPATFNSNFEMFARGFYAARALGIEESTHEKVFDAIWKSNTPPQDMGGVVDMYVRLGADRARFTSALSSLGVQTAVNAAGVKAERLKLEGTPTLYVDGKYQVLPDGGSSYDDIFQRVDALIVKARAEHKAVRK